MRAIVRRVCCEWQLRRRAGARCASRSRDGRLRGSREPRLRSRRRPAPARPRQQSAISPPPVRPATGDASASLPTATRACSSPDSSRRRVENSRAAVSTTRPVTTVPMHPARRVGQPTSSACVRRSSMRLSAAYRANDSTAIFLLLMRPHDVVVRRFPMRADPDLCIRAVAIEGSVSPRGVCPLRPAVRAHRRGRRVGRARPCRILPRALHHDLNASPTHLRSSQIRCGLSRGRRCCRLDVAVQPRTSRGVAVDEVGAALTMGVASRRNR